MSRAGYTPPPPKIFGARGDKGQCSKIEAMGITYLLELLNSTLVNTSALVDQVT